MLRSSLLLLVVLVLTPLLASPLAVQEGKRTLASVGEMTDLSYFNAFSPYGAQTDAGAELRASYQFFSDYLAGVSLDYMQGVEAAREGYGLRGPIFGEPMQPRIAKFDLTGMRGYGSPNLWGGMGAVINDVIFNKKAPLAAPNTSRPREAPVSPLKMSPKVATKTVTKST